MLSFKDMFLTFEIRTYFQIWYLNNITILIMGNNANNGGPIAFQIIRTYMDLTLVNVNKRFRLKPSGQTASTGSYKSQKIVIICWLLASQYYVKQ